VSFNGILAKIHQSKQKNK
jgi:hypothetical protein